MLEIWNCKYVCVCVCDQCFVKIVDFSFRRILILLIEALGIENGGSFCRRTDIPQVWLSAGPPRIIKVIKPSPVDWSSSKLASWSHYSFCQTSHRKMVKIYHFFIYSHLFKYTTVQSNDMSQFLIRPKRDGITQISINRIRCWRKVQPSKWA